MLSWSSRNAPPWKGKGMRIVFGLLSFCWLAIAAGSVGIIVFAADRPSEEIGILATIADGLLTIGVLSILPSMGVGAFILFRRNRGRLVGTRYP